MPFNLELESVINKIEDTQTMSKNNSKSRKNMIKITCLKIKQF